MEVRSLWVQTPVAQQLGLRDGQIIQAVAEVRDQRVRLWLHDPTRPIRFSAIVAWAAFEIPKSGPRYRAGLEFVDASQDLLRRFIDANT